MRKVLVSGLFVTCTISPLKERKFKSLHTTRLALFIHHLSLSNWAGWLSTLHGYRVGLLVASKTFSPGNSQQLHLFLNNIQA